METSLFLRLHSQDGTPSLPLLSLFLSFIFFFLPPFEELGCFSGCLMSSAGIQKLFCRICSEFKCSFKEFVGEQVVSLFYTSAILGPPLLPSVSHGTEYFEEYRPVVLQNISIPLTCDYVHVKIFLQKYIIGDTVYFPLHNIKKHVNVRPF